MGASKKDHGEITEHCLLDMSREFYEDNEELLSANSSMIAAYVKGMSIPKTDTRYIFLYDEYKQARENLREYEYEMRYKINTLK